MRPNKLRELLKSNMPTLSTHIHTTWPSVVDAVASAPAAFRIRVWHLMSRGQGPRGGDRCRRSFVLPILYSGKRSFISGMTQSGGWPAATRWTLA
jgi:hypothetical protein